MTLLFIVLVIGAFRAYRKGSAQAEAKITASRKGSQS